MFLHLSVILFTRVVGLPASHDLEGGVCIQEESAPREGDLHRGALHLGGAALGDSASRGSTSIGVGQTPQSTT